MGGGVFHVGFFYEFTCGGCFPPATLDPGLVGPPFFNLLDVYLFLVFKANALVGGGWENKLKPPIVKRILALVPQYVVVADGFMGSLLILLDPIAPATANS